MREEAEAMGVKLKKAGDKKSDGDAMDVDKGDNNGDDVDDGRPRRRVNVPKFGFSEEQMTIWRETIVPVAKECFEKVLDVVEKTDVSPEQGKLRIFLVATMYSTEHYDTWVDMGCLPFEREEIDVVAEQKEYERKEKEKTPKMQSIRKDTSIRKQSGTNKKNNAKNNKPTTNNNKTAATTKPKTTTTNFCTFYLSESKQERILQRLITYFPSLLHFFFLFSSSSSDESISSSTSSITCFFTMLFLVRFTGSSTKENIFKALQVLSVQLLASLLSDCVLSQVINILHKESDRCNSLELSLSISF